MYLGGPFNLDFFNSKESMASTTRRRPKSLDEMYGFRVNKRDAEASFSLVAAGSHLLQENTTAVGVSCRRSTSKPNSTFIPKMLQSGWQNFEAGGGEAVPIQYSAAKEKSPKWGFFSYSMAEHWPPVKRTVVRVSSASRLRTSATWDLSLRRRLALLGNLLFFHRS